MLKVFWDYEEIVNEFQLVLHGFKFTFCNVVLKDFVTNADGSKGVG